MDFYDVLTARKSVRGYKNDPIPANAVERIAKAVSLAPTACNRQPFKLLLIRNEEMRKKIAAVYPQKWLAEAPAIVVALGNESQAWNRLEGDSIVNVDVAIAMEHFVLAAAAEGLGTCWICAFNRDAMNKALGVTAPWRSVAISPLGFADKIPLANSRKPVTETFEVLN